MLLRSARFSGAQQYFWGSCCDNIIAFLKKASTRNARCCAVQCTTVTDITQKKTATDFGPTKPRHMFAKIKGIENCQMFLPHSVRTKIMIKIPKSRHPLRYNYPVRYR